MPRISSTSPIIGTGFMKCMPMNLPGRSVTEASRVTEIDEVLVASSTLAGRPSQTFLKISRLTALVLGRRLDDQVAVGERLVVEGWSRCA